MTEYLTTVSRRRVFCSRLLVGNGFVEGILKQDVNHGAETEDRQNEVQDVRRTLFVGNDVSLLAHLVCPEEAVDATGYQSEQEGFSAGGVVFTARGLVHFVGQTHKPVDSVDAAGDEGQNDGGHDGTLLDPIHVGGIFLGFAACFQRDTAIDADDGVGNDGLAAIGAECVALAGLYATLEADGLILIHRLSTLFTVHGEFLHMSSFFEIIRIVSWVYYTI